MESKGFKDAPDAPSFSLGLTNDEDSQEWTRVILQQKMNCTTSYADTLGTKMGMTIYFDLIPPSFFMPISDGEICG